MKQSRATSFIKSVVSTAVGFVVAFLANMIILPWFGLPISHSANLLLTTIYTVISIGRGYALERVYEALGWRTRMSAFALAVLAERQRQIHVEGWALDHDDRHEPGDLSLAAASYSSLAWKHLDPSAREIPPPPYWPWSRDWWKPTGFRRDLVKAAALILAEGERFDRNRKPKQRPLLATGYQPADGPRPAAPTTGSGVVPPFAHGKTRSEHAGPSA